MLTEDEARTKECRFGGMITGRSKMDAKFPKCIGSQCMGWVATVLPLPATISLVTGNIITQAQPGRGRCGYVRGA